MTAFEHRAAFFRGEDALFTAPDTAMGVFPSIPFVEV